MTTQCATYVADPSFQITQGGATGPYDCTAHSCSDAIDHATCGAKDPGGRTIRLKSSEPVPDPRSPGLNLLQIQSVALEYGVYLEVHTGWRRLTWTQYETRRLDGQGMVVQLQYARIADSKYDAFGSRFRGGHAMFESLHATYDPGADGRITGSGERAWKWDGTVYPRSLIRAATAELVISDSGAKVGAGYVWAASTRDVVPDFYVVIRPTMTWWRYYADRDGKLVRRQRISGRSFSADCTPPKWFPVHRDYRDRFAKTGYSLVTVTDSTSAYNKWILSRQYAHEA